MRTHSILAHFDLKNKMEKEILNYCNEIQRVQVEFGSLALMEVNKTFLVRVDEYGNGRPTSRFLKTATRMRRSLTRIQ